MKRLFTYIIFATITLSPAAGQDLTGTSNAIFQEPASGFGRSFTGVETNVFTTGTPVGNSSTNRLQIDGVQFSTVRDQAFRVADFTYFNGITTTGTVVSDIPVILNLSFDDESIQTQSFFFSFDLDVTENNSGTIFGDADFLEITNIEDEGEVFAVNGENLTLRILGFSDDGGSTIFDDFTLFEDSTVTSSLFATIAAPTTFVAPPVENESPTQPTPSVPSPSAFLAGFGLMVGLLHRRPE